MCNISCCLTIAVGVTMCDKTLHKGMMNAELFRRNQIKSNRHSMAYPLLC